MIVERRTDLQFTPYPNDRREIKPVSQSTGRKIPACRIIKGPFGIYFAYRKDDTRPAPGTNYMHAWETWCRRFI